MKPTDLIKQRDKVFEKMTVAYNELWMTAAKISTAETWKELKKFETKHKLAHKRYNALLTKINEMCDL